MSLFEINLDRLKETRLNYCPCSLIKEEETKCPCLDFICQKVCRCKIFKQIEEER